LLLRGTHDLDYQGRQVNGTLSIINSTSRRLYITKKDSIIFSIESISILHWLVVYLNEKSGIKTLSLIIIIILFVVPEFVSGAQSTSESISPPVCSGSQNVSITQYNVNNQYEGSGTGTVLPAWISGQYSSFQLEAQGGIPPYHWAYKPGSKIPGQGKGNPSSLSEEGLLSWTAPVLPSSHLVQMTDPFIVMVWDSDNPPTCDEETLTITIKQPGVSTSTPITISPTTLAPTVTTHLPMTSTPITTTPSSSSPSDSNLIILFILFISGTIGIYWFSGIRKRKLTEGNLKDASVQPEISPDISSRPDNYISSSGHHDIFISYGHVDKPVADAICASLEAANIRCWIAPRDVLPGESFPTAIIQAIEKSRIMVLVFSSHSNNSSHVIRELTKAVNKGVIIIPFRIEDVSPSQAMEYLINVPHWLDALTPPLEQHIQKLVQTVKLLLEKTENKGI
jgi:hypothetical protein